MQWLFTFSVLTAMKCSTTSSRGLTARSARSITSVECFIAVSKLAYRVGPRSYGQQTHNGQPQLSSALVFELGGYEEAAEAIARCFQEIAGDQKRPAQAMHMLIVILRFIIMGLPATTKRQRWARTKENKAKKREQNKRSHQARMKRKRQQQ